MMLFVAAVSRRMTCAPLVAVIAVDEYVAIPVLLPASKGMALTTRLGDVPDTVPVTTTKTSIWLEPATFIGLLV